MLKGVLLDAIDRSCGWTKNPANKEKHGTKVTFTNVKEKRKL